MKIRTVLGVVSLFCLILIGITGCETTGVKEGTKDAVGWVRSELKVALSEDLTDVNNAIEAVCKDLKLFQISKERDLLGGIFLYRNAKNEKITLTTEAKTSKITELRIQVGLVGNKAQSELILEKIKEELK